jgi:putative selenate reductase
MIIEILRGWDELQPVHRARPRSHIFDLSVGYDLAGISSEAVAAYIDGMIDARDTIELLRPEIPEPFAAWRDHPFPTRIASSVTLSTFHGCPPDEVSAISRHLMTRHGLDVVVKLNPTLLGFDRVAEILSSELGYEEIRLRRPDFEADLSFPRALELIDDLTRSPGHGRRLGSSSRTRSSSGTTGLPPDDPMYLSARPHVLSTSLLGNPRALPGRLARRGSAVEVSFSAGHEANLSTWPGWARTDHGLLGPPQAGWLRAPQADAERSRRRHDLGRMRGSRGLART